MARNGESNLGLIGSHFRECKLLRLVLLLFYMHLMEVVSSTVVIVVELIRLLNFTPKTILVGGCMFFVRLQSF